MFDSEKEARKCGLHKVCRYSVNEHKVLGERQFHVFLSAYCVICSLSLDII